MPDIRLQIAFSGIRREAEDNRVEAFPEGGKAFLIRLAMNISSCKRRLEWLRKEVQCDGDLLLDEYNKLYEEISAWLNEVGAMIDKADSW